MAFLVDTIVLLTFILFVAMAVFGGFLVTTDFGQGDVPGSFPYAILALALAVIPVWLAFNVALCCWRGQTVGKYVVDIKVVQEDGRPPGLRTTLVRFLTLHPLLFHPVLAVLWVLTAAIIASVTYSKAVVVVVGAVVFLSLAAPLLAGGSVLLDGRRRALHDRVAGTAVVSVNER